MTVETFAARLHELADAWARRDYARAAGMFASEVVYVDPLRYRLDSRTALRTFFENDDGLPQRTWWRTIIYDPEQRTGCAEYSYTGTHAYHGTVLIRVDRDGLFDRWREYQHVVDVDWHDWWGAAVD
jgi:hypothetical protein